MWFEAASVGAREGLQLAMVWLLLSAWAQDGSGRPSDPRRFLEAFLGGVGLTGVVFALSFLVKLGPAARVQLSSFTGYVFFWVFLLGLAALYGAGESWPVQRARAWMAERGAAVPAVMLATTAFFTPDVLASSVFLRELARMRETSLAVYVPAALAFGLCAGGLALLLRGRLSWLGRMLGVGQLLVVLALVKLVAGGSKGIAEFTLIPAVQSGTVAFLHHFIHMNFELLMLPDHPLIKPGLWASVTKVLSSHAAYGLAVALVLAPPTVFLYELYSTPIPPAPEGASGPERRSHVAAVRMERRGRGFPVGLFVVVVLGTWGASLGDLGGLMLPEPIPIIPEGPKVVIPVRSPLANLDNGDLHKFSMNREGVVMRFMVIRQSDGHLATTLDACMLCPPDEGYAVADNQLICVYCGTPIAVDTLGEVGGCTPVPLPSKMTEAGIEIDVAQLEEGWRLLRPRERR